MTLPVYQNTAIGAAVYEGFTYGGAVVFDSSGNFVKDDYPGLRAVLVECQGGCGSGGNCEATAAGEYAVSGAGAGGAYARKLVLAVDLDDTEAVTVGAGATTSSRGGTSSFGSHCTAQGGESGATGTAGSRATDVYDPGAEGGRTGTGDVVIPGADAGPRIGTGASGVKFGFPLPGAYSHLGRRGGAGQRRNQNQTALGRTAGEPGIVVVHLYY